MPTPAVRVESTEEAYGSDDVRIGGRADLDGHAIVLCADIVDEREIIDTVIHETLHLVLEHIEEHEASLAIDNTYRDYHR